MMIQAGSIHGEIDRRVAMLAQSPLLRGVSAAALSDLADRLQCVTRPAGSVLVDSEEAADALYLIGAGRVRMTLASDSGRSVMLAELGRGEFFGESVLVDGSAQVAAALALRDVTLFVWPRAELIAHLRHHPAMALQLAVELSRRVAQAHEAMGDMALLDVEQRVVRALVRWGARNGATTTRDGLYLPRRPTHQYLADMVGASRETVTRALSKLAREELVRPEGGGVVITTERPATSYR